MSDDPKTMPDGMADMMRLWFDMASQATDACQAMAGSLSPDAFRSNRANLFKVWGDYWEQFLRSSPFLDAQKQFLTGGTESRNRMREYLGWLHHEMQLASSQDIDQVIKALRRLGEDIGEQFEQVDRRLKNLNAQLDSLGDRLEAMEKKARVEKNATPEPSQ